VYYYRTVIARAPDTDNTYRDGNTERNGGGATFSAQENATL